MTLFTWFLCQILGGCLAGFCKTYTFLQWVGMLAAVNNNSDCLVCTHFPNVASAGVPWRVHPANQTSWDWPQGWKASDPLYKQRCEKVFSITGEQANRTKP